jgi:hypothetical protein
MDEAQKSSNSGITRLIPIQNNHIWIAEGDQPSRGISCFSSAPPGRFWDCTSIRSHGYIPSHWRTWDRTVYFTIAQSRFRSWQSLGCWKNSSPFTKPEVHYRAHNNPLLGPVMSQFSPVHVLTSFFFFAIHFHTTPPSKLRPSTISVTFRVSVKINMHFSFLPCVLRVWPILSSFTLLSP